VIFVHFGATIFCKKGKKGPFLGRRRTAESDGSGGGLSVGRKTRPGRKKELAVFSSSKEKEDCSRRTLSR